jgi:leucyl aminopeptidase
MAGAAIGVGDALDPAAYAHAPFGLPAGDWAVAAPWA